MKAEVTLSAIVAEPARVADVPPDALPGLLAQLAAVQAVLTAKLASVAPAASNGEPDHLLGIEEASERLGVTADWLRRRRTLPFRVQISPGIVRYSAHGIAAFIEANRQNGT